MTDQLDPEAEAFIRTAKRNFDLGARLKNRGLRKDKITLYLDEELGPKLGDAHDVRDAIGNIIRRRRTGLIGDIEVAELARQEMIDQHADATNTETVMGTAAEQLKNKKALDKALKDGLKSMDETLATQRELRDELIEQLTKSGITLTMRAVPPVIEKDCRRKAKATLDITTKNIPSELEEEFSEVVTAHTMAVIVQTVTDNETGETNEEFTYQDAVDMIGWLPPGQMARLDAKLGELQFTDAISRSIEEQEDFS